MGEGCPKCRAPLGADVVRCYPCGADLAGVSVEVPLQAVAGSAFTAADHMDELESLAPATMREWKRLDLPRKARVVELLAALMAYLRGGKA